MNNPSKEKVNDILYFFRNRRAVFDTYISQNGLQRIIKTCKSCGFPTLEPTRFLEICPLCNWQDDVQDDHDADKIYGGPNYKSLIDSRIEFGLELDESGFDMNATIIQKPEILLTILKEYEQKIQHAATESINKKSADDLYKSYMIMINKLIEEVFKNR